MTDKNAAVVGAARAYLLAADEANAVYMENGRRGASDAAVDLVNRYRARAKGAHDRLMDAIRALEEDDDERDA